MLFWYGVGVLVITQRVSHTLQIALNNELSQILAKLFNSCLKKKTFPSLSKNAAERPLPSHDILLSISKLFDVLINKNVVAHLDRNNLLWNEQYEFSPIHWWCSVIIHRLSEAVAETYSPGP